MNRKRPRIAPEPRGVASRAIDWQRVEEGLFDDGYARTPSVLKPAECRELVRLYPLDERFRSRVDMERHRFGRGSYGYFADPLPRIVAVLRATLYAGLAPMANRWHEALGRTERYPPEFDEYRAMCHAAGQRRPTPLLLRYERGGYNRLHRDLYGKCHFPFQVTIVLSRSGVDYTGGEFLLVENTPRNQARGEAIPLERGEMIVFPVLERPILGRRGWLGAEMRHGISRVTSGERYALGIIFHDAAYQELSHRSCRLPVQFRARSCGPRLKRRVRVRPLAAREWTSHARGMAHAVTRPTEPFKTADGSLEIHQIPAASDNLIWLAVATNGSEVAAVDGPDASSVLDYCSERGLRLTTIVNTHTHHDHIGINLDLQRRGLLSNLRVIGPKLVASDVPGITEAVEDGDVVVLGGCTGRVLLTEGHIDGHISYVFSDVLFCGDTLFAGGCGYLFDGPPPKMFESLRRLSALDGGTKVCCAHEYTQDNLRFAWSVEPENAALADRIRDVWRLRSDGRCTLPSTIAVERGTNPFLRYQSPSVRKHVQEAMPEAELFDDCAVFTATRALKDKKRYRSISEEALPLHR